MGMGYGAGFAVTIEKEDLEKLGLVSYDNFLKTLKDEDIDISEFAIFSQDEDLSYVITMGQNSKKETIESIVENDEYAGMDVVAEAYLEFVKEFKDKYNMLIHLNFHDSETYGDRYDDVDGEYYSISFGDVFTETKEAKKFKEEVGFSYYKISRFVTFG